MRREHERGTVGDLVHVVDEDHAPGPELVHDMSVVDDLVVAVHRRLEDPDHPRQGLDRLLDSGTKAPGRGQQDTLDRHLPRLPAPCRRPTEAGRASGPSSLDGMSAPRVVSVADASPAQRAGLRVNDELLAVDGRVPRDVIEYRLFVDEADPELEIRRGHEELTVQLRKAAGEVPGIEVSSALFDRVRTCDNHCEFCFIYQLPKGMRRSLYLKDDDYRLSFLYGNFTTLTRFTELDLERVLTERLSPLFVSIHSTDPELRARMLRNPRGATSLRWLRALFDGGIEVHGQVVVCPGVNDGDALETTLAGLVDEYPDLTTVACVPLGVSDYTTEPSMRPHTVAEAAAVIDLVEQWQELCLSVAGQTTRLRGGRVLPPRRATLPGAGGL